MKFIYSKFKQIQEMSLPFDLLTTIGNFLDFESWKTFRLISKQLNNAAVYPYRNVRYLPMTLSFKRDGIINVFIIRKLLKPPVDSEKIISIIRPYLGKSHNIRLFGNYLVSASEIIQSTIYYSQEYPETDWGYTFSVMDDSFYWNEIAKVSVENAKQLKSFVISK